MGSCRAKGKGGGVIPSREPAHLFMGGEEKAEA